MEKTNNTAAPMTGSLLTRLLKKKMTPDDYEQLRCIYLKLPLPPVGKRLAKRVFLLGCRLGRALAGGGAEDYFDRPFVFPQERIAPQRQGKADYFVFGIIDWRHFQQRPQHFSRGLAELGHRVFFISPQLQHADHKGFGTEPLDREGRLFSIRIHAYLPCNIHYRTPDARTVSELLKSVGELLCWTKTLQRVFLVEHPAWHGLVSQLPGGTTVYDCMDYHQGFDEGKNQGVRCLENALLACSDLTVASSQWLQEAVKDRAQQTVIIRNAGEYSHFSSCPESVFADAAGRRTLGYYGMIAEWFDVELMKKLATAFPDCRLLVIGDDTVNAQAKLKKYPNIIFTGKIPYAGLPAYLHAFDVCLLPFKPMSLVQATNPVKVYEYLSAGKPVVSIDIPEMMQFEGLVYTAKDHFVFVKHVRRLLQHGEDPDLPGKRRDFAQNQTWQQRAQSLESAVDALVSPKRLSIVIVTYNNLHLTRSCLESVEKYTFNSNHEVIVVDNASTDGTREFLGDWHKGHADRHVLLNSDNRGFAAANNQGLCISTGDYFVLLNNDTYVTPGWDVTLMRHMQRLPSLGLLCPVTNNIGNEAKIDIAYKNMEEMLAQSHQCTCRHAGRLYPLRTTAFFCVMIPQTVFENVGFICEEYERGWFEDDDYCRRAEQLGYTMACAEDAFVHHELSASFNALPDLERKRLFEENKTRYEKKWGPWIPHKSRPAI